MKLYRVTIQGINSWIGIDYNTSYVVADNSDSAYQKVREYLDKKDIGFEAGRRLKSVELIAEEEFSSLDRYNLLFGSSYEF